MQPTHRNRLVYCNPLAGEAAWVRRRYQPTSTALAVLAIALSQTVTFDGGVAFFGVLAWAWFEERRARRGGPSDQEQVRITWHSGRLRVWRGTRQSDRFDAPDEDMAWQVGVDAFSWGEEELVFHSDDGTVHVPAPCRPSVLRTVTGALASVPELEASVPWVGSVDRGQLMLRMRKRPTLFPARTHTRVTPQHSLAIGALAAVGLLVASVGSVSADLTFTDLLATIGYVGFATWMLGIVVGQFEPASRALTVEVHRAGVQLNEGHRRSSWTWDEIDAIEGDGTTLLVTSGGRAHAYDLRDSEPEQTAGLVTDLRRRWTRHRTTADDLRAADRARQALAQMHPVTGHRGR